MDLNFIIEAIKFFENIKPAVEGLSATGTVIASTASVTISVIKNGAKMFSYLIKRPEKKSSTKKAKSGNLDISSDDIAIVVDIAQPILENVGVYLKEHKIDADVVLVTNREKYSDKPLFLKLDETEWEKVVSDFVDIMYEVRRSSAGRKIHIFSSAPVPISFAIGAMWGTVQNATLYHWQDDAYHAVIRVRRDIRSD
jgi:NACalpha-BTF3-like transcription factor